MKPLPTMKIAGLIVTAMLLTSLTSAARTAYADALLTGAVTSASGEKMGGVTVSAKAEKSPITTSVFTDESGNYYFPPLPNGKYQGLGPSANLPYGPTAKSRCSKKPRAATSCCSR